MGDDYQLDYQVDLTELHAGGLVGNRTLELVIDAIRSVICHEEAWHVSATDILSQAFQQADEWWILSRLLLLCVSRVGLEPAVSDRNVFCFYGL